MTGKKYHQRPYTAGQKCRGLGRVLAIITAYTDRETVKRIHEQVPGAPVIAKPLYRQYLAKAVAVAGEPW
jgi:hypothetical protein